MSTTTPCACGCNEEVTIDGLGTARSESEGGIKFFFKTETCRERWLKSRPIDKNLGANGC